MFQVDAITGSETYWQVPLTCSLLMKQVKPDGPSPWMVAGRPTLSIAKVWYAPLLMRAIISSSSQPIISSSQRSSS